MSWRLRPLESTCLLSLISWPLYCSANASDSSWFDNTSLNLFYSHSTFNDTYRVGFSKNFSHGVSGQFEFSQDELSSDEPSSARSYSIELNKELGSQWLLTGYYNQWDGNDAVEATALEAQISRSFAIIELGIFAGLDTLHLTGTGLEGNSLARDLEASSAGVELRLFPTDRSELSLRYTDYSHDFIPENLNFEQRPELLLILSPDAVGVIGSLRDHHASIDGNLLLDRWLLGATVEVLESAVDQLATQAVTLYADFDWRTDITLSFEIGQQDTESFEGSTFSGIGARFYW